MMIYKRVRLFICNFRRYFPSSQQRRRFRRQMVGALLGALHVYGHSSHKYLCTEPQRRFSLMADSRLFYLGTLPTLSPF